MLGFGVQIFGANAINLINYQADIILIGYFLTATDVGYYAVAVGLSKFFWLIPQAIQTITYPATSEYWASNNHSALQTMIDKSMRYTACILLPIGLGVGFFAEEIVTMIFGDGFSYSVLPLQILIAGTVIFGIACKPIGGSLSGVNRPDLSLKTTSSGAIINIILNVLLIPYFGIVGAAVATAVSLIVMAFVFVGLAIKTLLIKVDIKWFAQTMVIASIAIFSFVVGNRLTDSYILEFGILIIFIPLILAVLLTKEDKSLLKTFTFSLK
jgi:O-antigen/teichoic acid export membrane protein